MGEQGEWLDAERIAEFARRLRFDALLVSTPDDDPLAFIEGLGETAAAPPLIAVSDVIGQLLLDGFFRSYWEITEEDGVATLTIDRFSPAPSDPPDAIDEIRAEGARLLAFVAPDAAERKVRFEPSP